MGSAAREVAGVVSLDPAGVGISGIACRSVKRVEAGKYLGFPCHTAEGWVFEPANIDDLIRWCYKVATGDQRVVLVVENSAYGSFKIARHIGRAIGAVEMALHFGGYADPRDTVYVTPREWRQVFGEPVAPRRDAKKAQAVAYVKRAYGEDVGADLAEAIGINDHHVGLVYGKAPKAQKGRAA